MVGSLLLTPVLIAAMGADLGDDLTIAQLAVVAVGTWSVFLLALAYTGRRSGSGDPIADFGLRFRPIDLLAVPAGVVAQIAMIPLLYAPLRWIWPATFSDDRLEQRARELADRATGFSVVVLVVVVVVGAPIVEELVYRGLLQRSMAAAWGRWRALAAAAAWFAIIHLSPVEYPGLFVAGAVFGFGVALTGRIGPGILAHAAFNATGIVVLLADR